MFTFYDLTCCFLFADAELKFSILDVFNKPFGVTMTLWRQISATRRREKSANMILE